MTRHLALAAAVALLGSSAASGQTPEGSSAVEPEPSIEAVTIASPESPIVALRAMFRVGSIHDPDGKEGLAALTASMVGEAGTAKRSYAELVDALYPMAADVQVRTGREVTVLGAEVHREKLGEFTDLFVEILTRPGFDEKDFERLRQQQLAFLTTTLRAANDELLGLEAIQQEIFADHPYDHVPAGTVAGLETVDLDDVKRFYERHFTRANLMLGVAGGYPEGYVSELEEKLSVLPAGTSSLEELPEPKRPRGRSFTIIEKKTGSTGIHFGYPLPLTRADADYYPLMVANSYLGEHRTFHGRLMQQLRGKRGLNYGDYSYIEHYHLPPFTSNPTPNVPRRDQYFSVWIRPVERTNAHFALRAGLYEVDRLIDRGMTKDEFELARDFVVNYSKLWAQTLSDRLGFRMDSEFYDMPYFIDEIERRLDQLTAEEVNAAVDEYLRTTDYEAVIVTDGAAELKAALEEEKPSPMEYESEVDEEVLEQDEKIETLEVGPDRVEIVPVSEMFAGDSETTTVESESSEASTSDDG